MKKISLVLVLLAFVACKKDTTSVEELTPNGIEATTNVTPEELDTFQGKTVSPDGKYPVMTFEETEYNFGTIKQGDKVSHEFQFKNTGEADLIITNAQASCGCTVPEYPKDTPIKPGESGKIKVTFNSAGKSGDTTKNVTISCNTAGKNELLIIKTTIKVPS